MVDPRQTAHRDVLRPGPVQAAEAWAARVRLEREQVERCREVDDAADFYGPHAKRFAQDPRRTDDPALGFLRSMAEPGDIWLDLGAGGGRYALPLALKVKRVHAIEPSPSMLAVLRDVMASHDIANIDIHEGGWPMPGEAPSGDVALMAHVGRDIEDFGAFLDAAEVAASRRLVAVMRTNAAITAVDVLWHEIHAEERVRLPMLPELLVLLVARDRTPEVTLVPRMAWGYESADALHVSMRRMLWLRHGSTRDRRLHMLIAERGTARDGLWSLESEPLLDGIVTWDPSPSAR